MASGGLPPGGAGSTGDGSQPSTSAGVASGSEGDTGSAQQPGTTGMPGAGMPFFCPPFPFMPFSELFIFNIVLIYLMFCDAKNLFLII